MTPDARSPQSARCSVFGIRFGLSGCRAQPAPEWLKVSIYLNIWRIGCQVCPTSVWVREEASECLMRGDWFRDAGEQQQSAISLQPSAISHQPSAVSTQHSAFSYAWFEVRRKLVTARRRRKADSSSLKRFGMTAVSGLSA